MAAHQHVSGPSNPQSIIAKLSGGFTGTTSNAFAAGGLVFLDGGAAPIPASAYAWNTNLATTQAAAALVFRGITDTRSRVSSSDPRDSHINVIEDGFFDFNVVSAVYTDGQYLGINGTSGGMLDQLVGVATKSLALAIVTRGSDGATVTTVRGQLVNTPQQK
jgi:hypothetical protein